MTINEFLEQWTPSVSYINAGALKTRFAALRGLSNARPDLTTEQLIAYANNVLTVNQAQYEALAQLNPFKTYFEHNEGNYKDEKSGEDTHTKTDTEKRQSIETPNLENKMAYGKITDTTDTPTGIKQTDVTDYAYNATTATQPDQTTKESYNNFKDTVNEKLSGNDTETRTGTNTITNEVLGGNVENVDNWGGVLENEHKDDKYGYVLRDIVELLPEWVIIYDKIVADIFSVIGVLIATRQIDRRLEW